MTKLTQATIAICFTVENEDITRLHRFGRVIKDGEQYVLLLNNDVDVKTALDFVQYELWERG